MITIQSVNMKSEHSRLPGFSQIFFFLPYLINIQDLFVVFDLQSVPIDGGGTFTVGSDSGGVDSIKLP